MLIPAHLYCRAGTGRAGSALVAPEWLMSNASSLSVATRLTAAGEALAERRTTLVGAAAATLSSNALAERRTTLVGAAAATLSSNALAERRTTRAATTMLSVGLCLLSEPGTRLAAIATASVNAEVLEAMDVSVLSVARFSASGDTLAESSITLMAVASTAMPSEILAECTTFLSGAAVTALSGNALAECKAALAGGAGAKVSGKALIDLPRRVLKAPVYTRADFRHAFQSLLPHGRAWPRETDTVQAQAVDGLAGVCERQAADAMRLLADAFPVTAQYLLTDWEATLGLVPQATVQQRQYAAVAQLIGLGGQSVPYLISYAAALGYTISITQFAPARAGAARAGTPCYGNDWAFAWRVSAPLATATHARAGVSGAGEPLAFWGNATLESALRRIAAAHTVLIFSYT